MQTSVLKFYPSHFRHVRYFQVFTGHRRTEQLKAMRWLHCN